MAAKQLPPVEPQRLRILLFSYLAGLCFFIVIALVVAPGGLAAGDDGLAGLMTAVLVALGLGIVGVVAVMRRVREGKEQKEGEIVEFILLQASLAEGFGLFATVNLMLTGRLYFLIGGGIAIAALLALLKRVNELERKPRTDAEMTGPGPIEP